MAIIDIKKKLITGKIVYYGPGLCGKTTNLERINASVPNTDELMSLSTEGDRTIFFDYLPMELGKIRGISTTFKLYTVPGQVRYNLTRKMVLKNVDGVVFVADSQRPMMDANVESLQNLYDNLEELSIDAERVPIVLQYNKRDLPHLLEPDELDAALNQNGYPVYLASAVKGEGVLQTLKAVMEIVWLKLSEEFGEKPKKDKKKEQHKETKQAGAAAVVEQEPKKPKKPKRSRAETQKVQVVPPPPPKAAEKAVPPPLPDQKPKPEAKAEALPKPQEKADQAPAGPSAEALAELAKDLKQEIKREIEKQTAAIRKEIDTSLAVLKPATDKELDALHDEIKKLAKRKIEVPDRTEADKKIVDDVRVAVRHLTRKLATDKDVEALKTKLDEVAGSSGARSGSGGGVADGALVDEMRGALEQLALAMVTKDDLRKLEADLGKAVRAGGGSADSGSVVDETRRAVQRVVRGLASKEEIEQLKEEIGRVGRSSGGGGGVAGPSRKEIAEDTRAIASSLAQAMATKQDLVQLRGQIDERLKRTEAAITQVAQALSRTAAAPAAPAATEEQKPAETEEQKPAETEEQKPAETEEERPADAVEEEPAETEEEKPADAVEEKPAESEEEKPAESDEEKPAESEKEKPAESDEDLVKSDPRHKNAQRVARVMVADLKLYHAKDVEEGVREGDIQERLKHELEEMRKTYKTRVPEEIREVKDYLTLAVDEMIEKKRKELGIE